MRAGQKFNRQNGGKGGYVLCLKCIYAPYIQYIQKMNTIAAE